MVASFYLNDYLFTQVFSIGFYRFYQSKLYCHFLDSSCFFNNIHSHPLCDTSFYYSIHFTLLVVLYYFMVLLLNFLLIFLFCFSHFISDIFAPFIKYLQAWNLIHSKRWLCFISKISGDGMPLLIIFNFAWNSVENHNF